MRHSHRVWGLLAVPILLTGAIVLAATERLETMTGSIQTIDVAANTVTVAGLTGKKDQPVTFHLAPDVSITRNERKVGAGELKEKDRVTVRYFNEKGKATARSIAARPSDAPPGKLGR